MICKDCGAGEQTSNFCNKCGVGMKNDSAQAGNNLYSSTTPAPTPVSPGNSFSIGAIICGAISLLFFPIVLGPIGLVLAAVAKSKNEKNAVIGFVVAGVGMLVGIFFGAMFAGY